MRREKEKIKQYKLTEGEVLALYLYTGPEFVPMNGICRKFPQTIMKLLQGGGTTGDNKLCTTLFCISSALKKLSQKTPLPENRCAAQLTTLSMGAGERVRAESEVGAEEQICHTAQHRSPHRTARHEEWGG
jgi:hypothetical protein